MALNPADFTFSRKQNETLIKLPGSVHGIDFTVEDLDDCSVYILDHTSQVTVDYCKRCTIFIGAVDGPLFIRNCEGCTFIVACRQFRTRECVECDIYLYCNTKSPIIESSSNLRFHHYNGAYAGLTEHLKAANLNAAVNHWNVIYDFSANDDTIPAPHSIIISEVPARHDVILPNAADEELTVDTPFTFAYPAKERDMKVWNYLTDANYANSAVSASATDANATAETAPSTTAATTSAATETIPPTTIGAPTTTTPSAPDVAPTIPATIPTPSTTAPSTSTLVAGINALIVQLKAAIAQLKATQNARLSASFDDPQVATLEHNIDELTANIVTLTQRADSEIKALATPATTLSPAESTIRNNLCRVLASSLHVQSSEFRLLQSEYLERFKRMNDAMRAALTQQLEQQTSDSTATNISSTSTASTETSTTAATDTTTSHQTLTTSTTATDSAATTADAAGSSSETASESAEVEDETQTLSGLQLQPTGSSDECALQQFEAAKQQQLQQKQATAAAKAAEQKEAAAKELADFYAAQQQQLAEQQQKNR